jgi:hypothetical protein
LPDSVILDESICQFDNLAHQAGQRDFGWFSSLDHGLVFCRQVGAEARCDENWHLERIAQVFSPSLDEGVSTPFSGLSCHPLPGRACLHSREGGEASEGSCLFALQGADLGTLDQDCGGSDLTNAGN